MHLLGDALVSLGVVVGGVIISATGYTIVDPILSIIVSLVMIVSVADMLRRSIRMSFDGVPDEISIAQIRERVASIQGVLDIHHIHVWSISTTKNALTAHILLERGADEREIKHTIRHHLIHSDIHHTTLETEYERCGDEDCQGE